MKIVKYSTKEGKRLCAIGQKWEGNELWQVYDHWSSAKQDAWDNCYQEFCDTPGAENFGICSHNCQGFSVSWFTPDGMRLETPYNSYLVVFDD